MCEVRREISCVHIILDLFRSRSSKPFLGNSPVHLLVALLIAQCCELHVTLCFLVFWFLLIFWNHAENVVVIWVLEVFILEFYSHFISSFYIQICDFVGKHQVL